MSPTISTLLLMALALPVDAQPPAGRGPGGGMGRQRIELVAKFDLDQNGRLERAERDEARKWLAENANQQRRGRRPGGGREGAASEPPRPGAPVDEKAVANHADKPLYDTSVLRTLFLTFEHDDWEAELAAFYRTDVEVPVAALMDGKRLEGVGVRFRGNTSFAMVPAGRKRPMNLSADFIHPDQRLAGYKTLNLLNCHADPSFLREAVHAYLGRQFAPVPRASLVHVVINGESWGVFANVQQFNRDYLTEAFGTRKGARWRVPPDFRGNGGLKFLGDDPADYERSYQAKSGVDDKAVQRLVELCRVLNQTDVDTRRETLPSYLDIDGALWFLALDNVLLDGDGYLTRASDYALYMDPTGVFHPVTHDNNEILGGSMRPRGGPPPDRPGGGSREPRGGRGGRGPGGPGGPGGHRIEPGQSPLAGSDDENRPLLHGLLAVPEWRARYLAHVHDLALAADWDQLGPEVERLHAMIAEIAHADTRKLYDNAAFDASVENLRRSIGARLAALLAHESLAGPWPTVGSVEAAEQIDHAAVGAKRLRLVVSARPGPGVEIAEAVLHWQLKRPGPFAAIAMQRDDDGMFHATTPLQPAGETIHYYVELRAAGDSGRLAFSPAGASSGATRHRFGG